jgi:hypothetical protein
MMMMVIKTIIIVIKIIIDTQLKFNLEKRNIKIRQIQSPFLA